MLWSGLYFETDAHFISSLLCGANKILRAFFYKSNRLIFPVFNFWEEIYLFLIILIYKWFCLSVIFCECFPIFSWFSANITTYWKQLLPLLVLDLIVAFLLFDPFWKIYAWSTTLNPLSANSTKWSNTLKQFAGFCRQIVWVCLTVL